MKSGALASLLMCSLASAAAMPQLKPDPSKSTLSQVNALTQMLAPKAAVAAADLERLISVGEGVALRDGARKPTPATIIYAAAIEQAIRAGTVKGEGAQAVLAELAMALVPLSGPRAAELAATFYPELLSALAIDAKDAMPRPELPRELREIGQWGERTVASLADEMPARAAVLRMRAAILGGHSAAAADQARNELNGSHATDPRWHAWLGAALLATGKAKDAEPHLIAARAAGGEAAAIAREAIDRSTAQARADAATAALKAAGAPIPGTLPAACLAFATGLKIEKSGSSAALVACAELGFSENATEFLAAAAPHAPAGPAGAPIRAAHTLRSLFDRHSKNALNAEGRKAARDRYLADVATLPVDEPTRRVLQLLAHLGAADRPNAWAPGSPAEGALLSALDRESPCESASFALRAMAARHDPALLGRMLSTTIVRCSKAPDGAAVTADAIQLHLQLSYDTGAALPEEVAGRAAEVARLRPDDAEAIAVHADAIALKALAGKRTSAPLEAALSRYEDAIAHTSPSADPGVRQRLESNAAYLSVLVGQLAGDAAAARRARFYERSAQHLRLAIAFGETPALIAVRAQWDLDTKSGKPMTAQALANFPVSPSRARAACNLARQSVALAHPSQARALLAMAKGVGDDSRGPRLPELLIETVGLLEAVVDGKGLRPEVALHTQLFLTPACDAATIALPKSTHVEPAPSARARH